MGKGNWATEINARVVSSCFISIFPYMFAHLRELESNRMRQKAFWFVQTESKMSMIFGCPAIATFNESPRRMKSQEQSYNLASNCFIFSS